MSWTVTVEDWLRIGVVMFFAACLCMWWINNEIDGGGFDE